MEKQRTVNATCEACRLSKVKCSKERPKCARCLKANKKCIYRTRKRRTVKKKRKRLTSLTLLIRHHLFAFRDMSSRTEFGWDIVEILSKNYANRGAGVVMMDLYAHLRMFKSHLMFSSSQKAFFDVLRLDKIIEDTSTYTLDKYFSHWRYMLEVQNRNPVKDLEYLNDELSKEKAEL